MSKLSRLNKRLDEKLRGVNGHLVWIEQHTERGRFDLATDQIIKAIDMDMRIRGLYKRIRCEHPT